jgi:hypothetical protein
MIRSTQAGTTEGIYLFLILSAAAACGGGGETPGGNGSWIERHGSVPDGGFPPEGQDAGQHTECREDETTYASLDECELFAEDCRSESEHACGRELTACCLAIATCAEHQVEYASSAECQAAGASCSEVHVCCSTTWCAPDASALETGLTFSNGAAQLAFSHGTGLHYITCSDAFAVRKPLADGTSYEALTDQRPWSTNGQHYLDGSFEDYVFAGEGCDVLSCVPLEMWTPVTLSLAEYVSVGTREAPQGVVVRGGGTTVPELERRDYRGPIQIGLTLYADDECKGGAIQKVVNGVAP